MGTLHDRLLAQIRAAAWAPIVAHGRCSSCVARATSPRPWRPVWHPPSAGIDGGISHYERRCDACGHVERSPVDVPVPPLGWLPPLDPASSPVTPIVDRGEYHATRASRVVTVVPEVHPFEDLAEVQYALAIEWARENAT